MKDEWESKRDQAAYELAKKILEYGNTKGSVEDMISRIENQFCVPIRKAKIELAEHPVDRYGEKVEISRANSSVNT